MDKDTSDHESRVSDSSGREIPRSSLGSNPYELVFLGHHKGLLRLKQWVALHGALSLTLAQAAELACLTPHHFSAAFHKHAGETFKRWRHRARICWAVHAIETGQHSINEVIHLAGYQDRRAFERAIKQLTGATPGCIRRGAAEAAGTYVLTAKSES